jgi:hypothetical protein
VQFRDLLLQQGVQRFSPARSDPALLGIVVEVSGSAERRRQPDLPVQDVLVDDVATALVEVDGQDPFLQIDVGTIAQNVLDPLHQTGQGVVR